MPKLFEETKIETIEENNDKDFLTRFFDQTHLKKHYFVSSSINFIEFNQEKYFDCLRKYQHIQNFATIARLCGRLYTKKLSNLIEKK